MAVAVEGGDTALSPRHFTAPPSSAACAAAAGSAVDLRYAIEADRAASGRFRHWRIAGVPLEVIDLHSTAWPWRSTPFWEAPRRQFLVSPGVSHVGPPARSKKRRGGRAGGPVAGRTGVDPMAPERLTAAIDSAARERRAACRSYTFDRHPSAGRGRRQVVNGAAEGVSPAITSPSHTLPSTIATPPPLTPPPHLPPPRSPPSHRPAARRRQPVHPPPPPAPWPEPATRPLPASTWPGC